MSPSFVNKFTINLIFCHADVYETCKKYFLCELLFKEIGIINKKWEGLILATLYIKKHENLAIYLDHKSICLWRQNYHYHQTILVI